VAGLDCLACVPLSALAFDKRAANHRGNAATAPAGSPAAVAARD
jgi:hypothetical protein